jgi:hypothetical protein
MTSPTASIMVRVTAERTRSERVRPASTAAPVIGSERNRSMTPLVRSSARPEAVPEPPNRANWASRPGMSQLT